MDIIKVLFVKKRENGSFEIENIWCNKTVDKYYIVDNIPFVVDRISLGDVIRVELDEEEDRYYFEDFVAVSGNSTVQMHVHDEKIISKTRDDLSILGCETEAFLDRKIVAINVPKEISYHPVKVYLDKGEAANNWTYKESCLAHLP